MHDEVIKFVFNRVYDSLSRQHQNNLKQKIRNVLRIILANPEIRESLGVIERRGGYSIHTSLDKLRKEVGAIVKRFETQTRLQEFI